MKFKLVKFNDGTYGARRPGFFGYRFLDINGKHTWYLQEYVNIYCKTNKEQAELNILNYHDKGTLV